MPNKQNIKHVFLQGRRRHLPLQAAKTDSPEHPAAGCQEGEGGVFQLRDRYVTAKIDIHKV